MLTWQARGPQGLLLQEGAAGVLVALAVRLTRRRP